MSAKCGCAPRRGRGETRAAAKEQKRDFHALPAPEIYTSEYRVGLARMLPLLAMQMVKATQMTSVFAEI